MTSLLIQNFDEELRYRLEARAAAHRCTLEEEVQELLRAAVATDAASPHERLGDLAQRLFVAGSGGDLDILPRGSELERPPPDFSGPEYDPPSWR